MLEKKWWKRKKEKWKEKRKVHEKQKYERIQMIRFPECNEKLYMALACFTLPLSDTVWFDRSIAFYFHYYFISLKQKFPLFFIWQCERMDVCVSEIERKKDSTEHTIVA